MPATFQHIQKPRNVGIDIVVRRRERVAYAGLGGEMDHIGKPAVAEQDRHAIAVVEVELVETERVEPGELGKARLFERGIVILIEIVDADDGASARRKPLRHMESDESGGAGTKNRRPRHMAFSHPRLQAAYSSA